MIGKRQKQAGVKRGGFSAGAILMIGLAFVWLTPCSGMDALTQSELGELSGQQGITIGFGGAITVTSSFRSISQGDTDGWGNNAAYNRNPGWLVLIGTGLNYGTLSTTITMGQVMTIDVASTPATTHCVISGRFIIPRDTPFFSFTLTDLLIGLDDPQTVNVCLTNNPSGTFASMELVGRMNTSGLSIDLSPRPSAGKSTCYVWAH